MRILNSERGAFIVSIIIVLFWTLITIIPLSIVVFGSLKSARELALNPIGLPQVWQWGQYKKAFIDAHLLRALGNSALLTVTSLFFLVIFGASASYPLARRTKWAPYSYFFLSGIMVPFQLAMLPLYRLMTKLNLINTHVGVIFIYIAVSLPMTIFLYTGFVKGISSDLEDAAKVDGATQFRMFWQIIFPLLRPATSTVIIMNSISLWNDFFIVLLFLGKREYRTLQLAMYSFIQQYSTRWGLVFAAVVLSMIPMIIVFMILQKQFIKGLSAGAVKG